MLKLPLVLYNNIYKFCNKEEKEKLLSINRLFRLYSINNIKSILVSLPSSNNPNTSENVILKSINFYSCANTIIMNGLYTCGNIHAKFIKCIIASLNERNIEPPFILKKLKVDPNKSVSLHHFFNNIKKIKFKEIFGMYGNQIIEALCHENLESLTLNTKYTPYTEIIDVVPQLIFNKLLKLKKLKINCSGKDFSISLNQQTELMSVKFYNIKICNRTMFSLSACTKLETLIMELTDYDSLFILNLIINNNNWKRMKRLEAPIGNIISNDDLEKLTKNYPNLECLYINVLNVHNFNILAHNCPNIISLKLNCLGLSNNISDNDVHNIVKALPNLKILSLFNACAITGQSLTYISKYCINLKMLELTKCVNISMDSCKDLVYGCKYIKILRLTKCLNYNPEIYMYLINNLKELKYVIFDGHMYIHNDKIMYLFNVNLGIVEDDYYTTKCVCLKDSNRRIYLKIPPHLNVHKLDFV
jgi:hypothetical protein